MNEEIKSRPLCPVCGIPVLKGIRMRTNEHIVYCFADRGRHDYVEGIGDTFEKALEQFDSKIHHQQKELL